MRPEGRDPTDPREWIRRARSNLAQARQGPVSPDILYEDLCWNAQQAAEKALKAILVARQIEFPKTHSIAKLFALLRTADVEPPAHLLEASELTRFAVATRYPGFTEDVGVEDYSRALALAEHVFSWAAAQIESG